MLSPYWLDILRCLSMEARTSPSSARGVWMSFSSPSDVMRVVAVRMLFCMAVVYDTAMSLGSSFPFARLYCMRVSTVN